MIDLGINNYFIEVDSNGYTLKQKRNIKDKKTGETKEGSVVLGYFGNLETAVADAWRTAQRMKFAQTDCDLKEAIKIMNDIKQEFMDKLQVIRNAERE